MKDFHLLFARSLSENERWNNGLIDLLGDEGDLPSSVGGAYVIGTSGTMLTYPWGTSPIFYIGSTTDLNQRLRGHRKSMLEARNDWYVYWYSRHQYGAAFGAHVAWYSRRGLEAPKSLESKLIEAFYFTFGAIPSANAQFPDRVRPKREDENE